MKITDIKIGDVISGDDMPAQSQPCIDGKKTSPYSIEAVIGGGNYALFAQVGRGKWLVMQTGTVGTPAEDGQHEN